MIVFVTLDRMVWTLLDSLHLTTAVYPIEKRVIWAWFHHVSHVFLQKFKFLFLLPSVTLDRMVWTLLESLHLITAVYPIERRVIWAWFRHVSNVFLQMFKFLFLLPSVTLDRMVWTLLESLHLITAVYPIERTCHMGVVPSRESCVSAKVQISISITLCNFGQDGLDTLRVTTPHYSSLPHRKDVSYGRGSVT